MADAAINNEIWKDIPEYAGIYQASSLGRIRSLERYHESIDRLGRPRRQTYPSKVMAQHDLGLGYIAVCLTVDGKSQSKYIHRLVCSAFHGSCPEGKRDAHHKNNCRGNNVPENLEWLSSQQNQLAKRGHGTAMIGIRHHKSKITESDVRAIRQGRVDGLTNKQIGEKFGIGASQVQRIVTRDHWPHVK